MPDPLCPDVRTSRAHPLAAGSSRVDWVDYAKGVCIILVVMMHVTLGYGEDVHREGWLHHVVRFAQPFRMPDFFLISGLFLSRSIHAPLKDYLDRKVLHFAYFYVLWLAIQLSIVEAALLVTQPVVFVATFAHALIEPINTLWFVHMLGLFYLTTRLVRGVPAALVFAVAVGLHTAHIARIIDTDSVVINEFSNRYVFFFTGYVAAPWIFNFARNVAQWPHRAVAALAVWGITNGVMAASGLHFQPVLSLIMGFAGAAAIIAIASLLAQRDWARPLRYVGVNSIVIYLTFFFPKGVLTRLAAATVPNWDVATVSLLITAVAVISPLVFHRFIRHTPLNFLYVRPAAFRLIPARLHPGANLDDASPLRAPRVIPSSKRQASSAG